MTDFIDDYDEELKDNFFPKRKKEVLDVPNFLNKGTGELPTEEQLMQQAALNNVPGNQQNEEKNHLKQLEEMAVNYSVEEWLRLLYHAPFDMMCDELKRRGQGYEEYRTALLGADEIMKQLKL